MWNTLCCCFYDAKKKSYGMTIFLQLFSLEYSAQFNCESFCSFFNKSCQTRETLISQPEQVLIVLHLILIAWGIIIVIRIDEADSLSLVMFNSLRCHRRSFNYWKESHTVSRDTHYVWIINWSRILIDDHDDQEQFNGRSMITTNRSAKDKIERREGLENNPSHACPSWRENKTIDD